MLTSDSFLRFIIIIYTTCIFFLSISIYILSTNTICLLYYCATTNIFSNFPEILIHIFSPFVISIIKNMNENDPRLTPDTLLYAELPDDYIKKSILGSSSEDGVIEIIFRYSGEISPLSALPETKIILLSGGYAIAYTDRSGLEKLISLPQVILVQLPELFFIE